MRIGRRDRWEDRGVPDPDAMKELRRLADRLDDCHARLKIAEMHVEGCEADEAALDVRPKQVGSGDRGLVAEG